MADIASIIGQIRPIPIQQADPFKDINQSLTLKALMGQDKLQGLQIGQAERAASDEAALRGAGSMERVRAILGEQGRYKELQALDAADLAKREKESLIGRNTAQTGQANQSMAAARIKDARDALAGVSDQAGYDAWRQAHQGLPVVQSAPPAFAPDWQRRAVMSADQFITQMTPKFERVDLGGRVEMIDVNPLTNPAIRGTKYDKTMTPGEVASDRRAVAQLTETQRHNRVTETNQGVPTGYRRAEDGSSLEPIPGGPAKALTESQGKAAGLALRATKANEILNTFEDAGETNRGIIKQGVGQVPIIGGALEMGVNMLPGTMGGPNSAQQQIEQARRDFINAALRVESGASISAGEFQNAERQYFPMPGDSEATIKQKRQARLNEIDALRMQSGPPGRPPTDTRPRGGVDLSKLSDAELMRELNRAR